MYSFRFWTTSSVFFSLRAAMVNGTGDFRSRKTNTIRSRSSPVVCQLCSLWFRVPLSYLTLFWTSQCASSLHLSHSLPSRVRPSLRQYPPLRSMTARPMASTLSRWRKMRTKPAYSSKSRQPTVKWLMNILSLMASLVWPYYLLLLLPNHSRHDFPGSFSEQVLSMILSNPSVESVSEDGIMSINGQQ